MRKIPSMSIIPATEAARGARLREHKCANNCITFSTAAKNRPRRAVAEFQRHFAIQSSTDGIRGTLAEGLSPKNLASRLHLAGRGLELPGNIASAREDQTMTQKLTIVMTLLLAAASATGCNTCRQAMGGWFNRGDRCAPPPVNCPPGVPQATMMYPGTPQVLPGPIEIAPQP
jgi:hypothetical protein